MMSADVLSSVAATPVIVKNTFLDVLDAVPEPCAPKSQSCPILAFSGIVSDAALADSLAGGSELMMCDLAAAARMFSAGGVARSAMEFSGHLRPSPPLAATAATEHAPQQRARPLPPPLIDTNFSGEVPPAPAWSPKVRTPLC